MLFVYQTFAIILCYLLQSNIIYPTYFFIRPKSDSYSKLTFDSKDNKLLWKLFEEMIGWFKGKLPRVWEALQVTSATLEA